MLLRTTQFIRQELRLTISVMSEAKTWPKEKEAETLLQKNRTNSSPPADSQYRGRPGPVPGPIRTILDAVFRDFPEKIEKIRPENVKTRKTEPRTALPTYPDLQVLVATRCCHAYAARSTLSRAFKFRETGMVRRLLG